MVGDIPKTESVFLTLFDMGFFETSVMGGGGKIPHHNFVVIPPMIMKFCTGSSLMYSTQ